MFFNSCATAWTFRFENTIRASPGWTDFNDCTGFVSTMSGTLLLCCTSSYVSPHSLIRLTMISLACGAIHTWISGQQMPRITAVQAQPLSLSLIICASSRTTQSYSFVGSNISTVEDWIKAPSFRLLSSPVIREHTYPLPFKASYCSNARSLNGAR